MNSARHGQMAADLFHPYVTRPGVMTASFTPTFSAAESVDPTQPVEPNRTPSIVVSREESNGPVSLNQETSYTLVVTNPSPELIESAVVEEPPGAALHRVVNTEPPASLTPDGTALQWNVSNLRLRREPPDPRHADPGVERSDPSQTIVSLTTRVAGSTTIRTPYIPPEVPAAPPTPRPAPPQPTRPTPRPALTLDLEQPSQVEIGGDVRAYYVIRNTGDAPATDVVTYVTISDQLDHRYGEYLEHRMPELAAGDSRRIKFYAVGRAARRSDAHLAVVCRERGTGCQSLRDRDRPERSVPNSREDRGRSTRGPFPENQGTGPGPGNPAARPGTVPAVSRPPAAPVHWRSLDRPLQRRPDLDDGLPSRVQSTVPVVAGRSRCQRFGPTAATVSTGPGSLASPGPGFNANSGFNPGPDPLRPGLRPRPRLRQRPDPNRKRRLERRLRRRAKRTADEPLRPGNAPVVDVPERDRGNTGMPATDGQWRPNGAIDSQPSRTSIPTGPSGNSSIPEDKILHRRRDDDELARPNRKIVPDKKVDAPSSVPGSPYTVPGPDRGVPDQPYNGGFAPAVPGNSAPFSTELGQPQTIPYPGARSPDTGSPFPAEQPNFGRPAERPTDLFSPEPTGGPGGTDPFPGTGGRTRPQPSGRPGLSEEPQPTPFADPFPGNAAGNPSSAPFSPNPGGNSPSSLFPGDAAPGMVPPAVGPQPGGAGGTSIPSRRSDPVFFDDPVKSTIPRRHRTDAGRRAPALPLGPAGQRLLPHRWPAARLWNPGRLFAAPFESAARPRQRVLRADSRSGAAAPTAAFSAGRGGEESDLTLVWWRRSAVGGLRRRQSDGRPLPPGRLHDRPASRDNTPPSIFSGVTDAAVSVRSGLSVALPPFVAADDSARSRGQKPSSSGGPTWRGADRSAYAKADDPDTLIGLRGRTGGPDRRQARREGGVPAGAVGKAARRPRPRGHRHRPQRL